MILSIKDQELLSFILKKIRLIQLLAKLIAVKFIPMHFFPFAKFFLSNEDYNKLMNINHNNQPQFFSQKLRASQGGLTHTQSLQKQKPVFVSRVDRFSNSIRGTPGPGAYEFNLKQKHTQDFRVNRQRNSQSDIPVQHKWIYSNGRMDISGNKNIGPGMYNIEEGNLGSNNSSWAKKERFEGSSKSKESLGPGQYYPISDQTVRGKTESLSVFKSKAPRTFIEQIILREKKNQVKGNPEDEEEGGDTVVKFDESMYPIRKKIEKLSPVFLSKLKRPQIVNDHSPQRLGPGSYSLNLQKKNLKSSTGIQSAIHYVANPLADQTKETILSSKVSPPGPGSYITVERSNEASKKMPYGIFAKEQRFKPQQYSNIPGPSEYQHKRYSMINEQDSSLIKSKPTFLRKPQKNHTFGAAPRATLRNHNNIPFGQYNIQHFDMNYRLKKQQQHYQKLKMMQVTLPAFNSKTHN